MQIIAKSVIFEHLSFRKGSEVHFFDAGVSQTCFCKADKIPPYITPKNKLMDKSPLCTCLIEQDLEEAADPYEFLDKNYSISGILDNLDKLSPKELKCACCLFGVALQKACKKKRRW